jgi:type VI secretion system protein ImpK
MPELDDGFLLDGFVRVYEEAALLRQAQAEGRLASHLTRPGETPPANAVETARAMGARLGALIDEQARRVERHGGPSQRDALALARYVTCALLDEIFILELDWPGRDAWLEVLLEYRFFRTRLAGQHFFEMTDQLMLANGRDLPRADLAAIFLLALRLGFKGRHRGAAGAERLRELRERLFELARRNQPAGADGPAFPQAYQFKTSGEEARIAPLRPWLRAALLAALAYLVVSSVVWLTILEPFLGRHGG